MFYMKYFPLFLLLLFLNACQNNSSQKVELQKAENGDVYYGGTLKFNEEEYFKSLYPLNVTEVTGHRIINQVCEGLVSFNQESLVIEPCLAESWTISEDGKTYTFKIR